MDQNERRREERKRCSDPLWWRAERREDYRVGWLLERSAQGAAFVVRDSWPPNVTDLLEVHVWHGPDGRRKGRGFVVHRVRPVHDDLYLVAGRFVSLEDPAYAAQTHAESAAGLPASELASVEVEALPDLATTAPTAIWHG